MLTDDDKPERFRLARTDSYWASKGRTKRESRSNLVRPWATTSRWPRPPSSRRRWWRWPPPGRTCRRRPARLFDDVWAFLRLDGQERLRSDGHNVILYKDGVPHAEVGVIVTEAFDDAGRVTASVLPGATVARTVHRGCTSTWPTPTRRSTPGAPTTATA